MIPTVKVLVVVVVLIGIGGCQRCSEIYCPGNGCLTRNDVCNGVGDCPNGRGSNIDETSCSGKI